MSQYTADKQGNKKLEDNADKKPEGAPKSASKKSQVAPKSADKKPEVAPKSTDKKPEVTPKTADKKPKNPPIPKSKNDDDYEISEEEDEASDKKHKSAKANEKKPIEKKPANFTNVKLGGGGGGGLGMSRESAQAGMVVKNLTEEIQKYVNVLEILKKLPASAMGGKDNVPLPAENFLAKTAQKIIDHDCIALRIAESCREGLIPIVFKQEPREFRYPLFLDDIQHGKFQIEITGFMGFDKDVKFMIKLEDAYLGSDKIDPKMVENLNKPKPKPKAKAKNSKEEAKEEEEEEEEAPQIDLRKYFTPPNYCASLKNSETFVNKKLTTTPLGLKVVKYGLLLPLPEKASLKRLENIQFTLTLLEPHFIGSKPIATCTFDLQGIGLNCITNIKRPLEFDRKVLGTAYIKLRIPIPMFNVDIQSVNSSVCILDASMGCNHSITLQYADLVSKQCEKYLARAAEMRLTADEKKERDKKLKIEQRRAAAAAKAKAGAGRGGAIANAMSSMVSFQVPTLSQVNASVDFSDPSFDPSAGADDETIAPAAAPAGPKQVAAPPQPAISKPAPKPAAAAPAAGTGSAAPSGSSTFNAQEFAGTLDPSKYSACYPIADIVANNALLDEQQYIASWLKPKDPQAFSIRDMEVQLTINVMENNKYEGKLTPEAYLEDLKRIVEVYKTRIADLRKVNMEAATRYGMLYKISMKELKDTEEFIKNPPPEEEG